MPKFRENFTKYIIELKKSLLLTSKKTIFIQNYYVGIDEYFCNCYSSNENF